MCTLGDEGQKMTTTDIEGTRDEIIDGIAEDLKVRLLGQVIHEEAQYRERYRLVSAAMQGCNSTLAVAVLANIMAMGCKVLSHIVLIEPAEGVDMTANDVEQLRRDVVLEAVMRTVDQMLEMIPLDQGEWAKMKADLAVDAKQAKPKLQVGASNDLAPRGDETKH